MALSSSPPSKTSLKPSSAPGMADSAEDFADCDVDSIVSSCSSSTITVPLSPQDGPCSSTDGIHMATGCSKKDKNCLVCGDKALGYNFNAVSCESCKAFFRRNAHKVIRGRCQGKCEVTVESRSFCKKCRLAKCFTVGMRKDMILNDEQKKQRKHKILINKLRRQGQLTVEETYSASYKDLAMTSSLSSPPTLHAGMEVMSVHDTVEGLTVLKSEIPDFDKSPSELSTMSSLSPSSLYSVGSAPKTPDKAKYSPWAESQEQVQAAINALSDRDRDLILELQEAMESGSFLAMSSTTLTKIPLTPEDFFNIAELFVRKVIKVAKKIQFFRQLDKEDQISLLKGSVVDIMMLRSAVNYDPYSETWSLNTSKCLEEGSNQAEGQRISADILKNGSPEMKTLFLNYRKFNKSLMNVIHGDLVILKLLIIMSLFSADRMPMVDHSKVQEIQEAYASILQQYTLHRFPAETTMFAQIIMRLTDLRNINEVHSKMLLKMRADDFEPLLMEVFDIPAIPTDVDLASLQSSGATASSHTASASHPRSSESMVASSSHQPAFPRFPGHPKFSQYPS